MAILKLNGADAPSPSALRVELFDVGSDEMRSASGRLVTDRLAVKRRLSLRWALLTADELAALLNAVGEMFFAAVYPDPELGMRTAEFRCESRSAGVLRYVNGEAVWTDVEMLWTER